VWLWRCSRRGPFPWPPSCPSKCAACPCAVALPAARLPCRTARGRESRHRSTLNLKHSWLPKRCLSAKVGMLGDEFRVSLRRRLWIENGIFIIMHNRALLRAGAFAVDIQLPFCLTECTELFRSRSSIKYDAVGAEVHLQCGIYDPRPRDLGGFGEMPVVARKNLRVSRGHVVPGRGGETSRCPCAGASRGRLQGVRGVIPQRDGILHSGDTHSGRS